MLELVLDSVVDALVEHLEDIILLLHIRPDILIVLLPGKLFPTLQPLELLLVVHTHLQPLQHAQQLPNQQIPYSIGYFYLLSSLHGLFGDGC